jgi:hypothetical protein
VQRGIYIQLSTSSSLVRRNDLPYLTGSTFNSAEACEQSQYLMKTLMRNTIGPGEGYALRIFSLLALKGGTLCSGVLAKISYQLKLQVCKIA